MTGGAANTMEASSDQEVQEAAMQVLRNMYGEKVREPSACAVTRWGGDPYSRGGQPSHCKPAFLLSLLTTTLCLSRFGSQNMFPVE